MDFYEVIGQRRSIRSYLQTPVESEKLERILEAVRQAPTACNLQPFRFLIITAADKKAIIEAAYPQPWLQDAPCVIVALGNRDKAWKRRDGSSAHVIDVSIAMEHLVLAATAEGLGTCWICAFDQAALHKALGIGQEWDVVALTPLGYAAANAEPPKRKSRDELFGFLKPAL